MSSDHLKEGLQEQKSSKQEQDPHVLMSSKPQKESQKLMSSSQQPDAHGLKSPPQSHKPKNPMFFAPEKTKPPKEEKEKQKRKGKCSVCNATFQDASSLNQHMRSHVCSHCGNTFGCLIRHRCRLTSSTIELREMWEWENKSSKEAESRHLWDNKSSKEAESRHLSSTMELGEMWEAIRMKLKTSEGEKKSSKEAESRHLSILKTRQEMCESSTKELQEMLESSLKKRQEMWEWEKKSLEEAESRQWAIRMKLKTSEGEKKSSKEAESRHLSITKQLETPKSITKQLETPKSILKKRQEMCEESTSKEGSGSRSRHQSGQQEPQSTAWATLEYCHTTAMTTQSQVVNEIWDRSDTPPPHGGQAGQTRLKRSLSDGHVTRVTQRDQDSHSLPTKSVSCVDFTELRLVHEGDSHQPIFSRSWQFSKSFSSKGGRLQGVDSDIILFVPGDAVDDDVTRGCGTIPIQRKRHQSIANNQKEQATPEEDQMNNSEESDSTTAVTIRGATSIDLKGVRGKLKLSATESICSPVVEYYAGKNFVFKKPVCISLPHFLPPDADKSNVKVYQVSRSSDGEICVELLKLADTPNHDEGLEEGETGFTENTVSSLGSFYLSEEKRITIFTTHFTGYFCTHCKHGTDPPYLKFRLYGRHLQRRTRDVDLTLFIWDLRLDIRDFRKAGLPDPNDELTLVTSATLEAMTADMISDVRVAVRIHLPLETSGEEAIWRHKQRPNGSPRLQPKRSFDPRMFYPCLCHTEPERAVWSIQCREDHVPPWWFESYIDVGYIHRGDQSFNFLQAPEPQTLQVCLKLMNEVKSASAQTEADLGENTHAKQLSETTTLFIGPANSDEPMQRSCFFPLKQTGAFQAIPQNASNSDASNYHGSCTRSHNSCTHSQAATPSSQMAALPLNPEDSAASPSTGHQVAGDNSTKQVIYTNCTFNMQANKSTTNNNVGKLHDMNFGNTTNIASEGDQGVGTPQHHMIELDLPPVEEVLQQSLAHNSHIENGTDRSLE